MDVAALTAFLAPLLPWLLNVGGRFAEAAADTAGQDSVAFAQRLWGQLRGKVEAKDAAREAAEDVALYPDDEELRTVLRVQLKKILVEDPELAAEVSRIWQEAQAAGATSIVSTVTASGAGSVAIGRDATKSTITTGVQHPTKDD
jgi:hypothetical protein